MFTRGLAGRGVGRLGDFVNVPRKSETWLNYQPAGAATIIPGVADTTTAAVAGGTVAAAAGVWALGKVMKWW